MKPVDYAKIARQYDKNRRKLTTLDPALDAFVNAHQPSRISILDIGCGTGNYLEFHTAHFKDRNISWVGLEPEKAMLQIAHQKAPAASFAQGRAEHLPFKNTTFQFIAISFAFHHFTDKPRALDEIARIIASGGTLRYTNIDAQKMPGWIYYKYFPTTWTVDLQRFWPADRLQEELTRRGFSVSLDTRIQRSEWKLSEALEHFKNRDASQLWTITEDEYQKGLSTVQKELKENPNALLQDEMAFLTCIAHKQS